MTRRDPKLIVPDLGIYKPTIVPMVPKLLQRVYDTISKRIDEKGAVAKWLISTGLDSKA